MGSPRRAHSSGGIAVPTWKAKDNTLVASVSTSHRKVKLYHVVRVRKAASGTSRTLPAFSGNKWDQGGKIRRAQQLLLQRAGTEFGSPLIARYASDRGHGQRIAGGGLRVEPANTRKARKAPQCGNVRGVWSPGTTAFGLRDLCKAGLWRICGSRLWRFGRRRKLDLTVAAGCSQRSWCLRCLLVSVVHLVLLFVRLLFVYLLG